MYLLGRVEYVDVAGHGLGGDHVGRLGAVPGPVHLPLVVDLLGHLELAGARGVPDAEAAALALLLVVRPI